MSHKINMPHDFNKLIITQINLTHIFAVEDIVPERVEKASDAGSYPVQMFQ